MKYCYIYLMLLLLIFSCNRKQENSIDKFDNIINLSVSDSLFSDNELPMGTVLSMKNWKDILITCHHADDYRFSFIDSKTGKLITRWGQKGNAPNEFIDFGSDFFIQDSLLVFQSSMKKSINYVSIPAILRGAKEVLVKTEIYPYTADFRPLHIVPIGNRKVATGLFKQGVLGVLDENNNVITTNSAIAKDKGFKIRIPLAKIKKASSINIDIINNYKDYKTYGYEPPEGMKDTMQKSFVSLLAANVTSKQISTSLNMPVGSITINKIDSTTNNNLAGANFTIKRLATNEIVDSFTTTTTAHVTSNLLPGNYEITETAAPSGYYITDKTTNITITSNDLNKTKTITNSQAEVSIRKIDSVSKQVVSGAVLKIVNSANQTVKTITTTNDYTKITGLSLGTYKVVEVTAPDGYIVNSKAKEFTLSSTNPKVTLDYADQQNETIIVKKDAKTNTILAGATLKVINKDTSEVIDTFVTTTTGHSIKGLKAGTYKVIEEAAPSGYTKSDATVEFTISNNQTEVQTVTFYNSTNQISITKVDADTNEVLANAKFNILNSNNQIVKTFTTTKAAYLLDKLAIGKYYLEEIEAPSGYVLNKEKVAFEVTATTKNLQVVFKTI